jgi:hypothetical protein
MLLTVEPCAKTSVTSTHCVDARLRVSRLETQGWCHIHAQLPVTHTLPIRSWHTQLKAGAHLCFMLSSKETAAQCADLKYPMYKLYSVGYEHKALNVKVKVPCEQCERTGPTVPTEMIVDTKSSNSYSNADCEMIQECVYT